MDLLQEPETQGESQNPTGRRKYWFLGLKHFVTGALKSCAEVMQLKPVIRGGKKVSPVEQIRKQNAPIVIKNENHPATDISELCTPIQQRTYQQLLGIAL